MPTNINDFIFSKTPKLTKISIFDNNDYQFIEPNSINWTRVGSTTRYWKIEFPVYLVLDVETDPKNYYQLGLPGEYLLQYLTSQELELLNHEQIKVAQRHL